MRGWQPGFWIPAGAGMTEAVGRGWWFSWALADNPPFILRQAQDERLPIQPFLPLCVGILASAGVWIPVFAGMTVCGAGMTPECWIPAGAGMTVCGAGMAPGFWIPAYAGMTVGGGKGLPATRAGGFPLSRE